MTIYTSQGEAVRIIAVDASADQRGAKVESLEDPAWQRWFHASELKADGGITEVRGAIEALLYPEHLKLERVSDTSQAIGQYLDWLDEQGVYLMRRGARPVACLGPDCLDGKLLSFQTLHDSDGNIVRDGDRVVGLKPGEPCPVCEGTGEVMRKGWVSYQPSSIQERLAVYFNIDRRKLEQEKRAMLASIRAAGPR